MPVGTPPTDSLPPAEDEEDELELEEPVSITNASGVFPPGLMMTRSCVGSGRNTRTPSSSVTVAP